MVIMVVVGDLVDVPNLGLCLVKLVHPSGACVVRRKVDRSDWLLAADLADEAGLVSMADVGDPFHEVLEEDEP